MRKTLGGAGACIVLALLAVSGSASAGSGAFSDPAGDVAAAVPDIGSVTVNGDPATGTVTVMVSATGYLPPVADGLERGVDVWLDTDRNESTGDPTDGTEYALEAWNDTTGRWWDMGRWNGQKWE